MPKTYLKYLIIKSKLNTLLYVLIQKELYSLLLITLLLYINMAKDHEFYGFQLNLHGTCVANKVSNKKLIVVWHSDDLKVSHVDISDINNIAKYLSTISVGTMVHRGKVHDYFGMVLDYSEIVVINI